MGSRNDVQHFAVLAQGASEPSRRRAERRHAGNQLRVIAARHHALVDVPAGRVDGRVTERQKGDILPLVEQGADSVRRRVVTRVPRRPVVRHRHIERANRLVLDVARGDFERGPPSVFRLRHRDDVALAENAYRLRRQQFRVARPYADAV